MLNFSKQTFFISYGPAVPSQIVMDLILTYLIHHRYGVTLHLSFLDLNSNSESHKM